MSTEQPGRRRRSARPPSSARDDVAPAATTGDQRSASADPESATAWLSRVIHEAHLSYREASKLVGREESYFWQMLQKGRSRSLPTPEELARLVTRLRGVTLVEALEKVWRIDRDELARDLAVLAARGDAGTHWDELDPAQREGLDSAILLILRQTRTRGDQTPQRD